ncbi:MAG TPA: SPFH domain-containing protein [Thermoanaerobaculia bacterium]|jgi:regulator of protease activity HflC (stomatin/prohibitin superfamily)
MTAVNVGIVVAIVLALAAYLYTSIRIIPGHERAVIFRLGRIQPQPKGPGIVMVLVPIDRAVRVSMAEQKLDVPAQDVVTRNEMTRRVAAEVGFRVLDPIRALTESADYRDNIVKLASVALVAACRQIDADEIGAQTATIGAAAKKIMEDPAGRLGVYVSQVKVVEA